MGWNPSSLQWPQWRVQIRHNGEDHQLGQFDDEQEAARAFGTAVRRLRPTGEAHGGRTGGYRWMRLNFPRAEEEAFAAQQGMPGPGAAEDKSAVVAKAEAQGFRSDFLGVSWPKRSRQWTAEIRHNGEYHKLGRFDDDQEAARAFDEAARRLRSKGEAHGGRAGSKWRRVNFSTAEEEAFAAQQGMPGTRAEESAAVALQAQGFRSDFIGVSWQKSGRQWIAQGQHNGENHYMGYFDGEQEAARAYDTAARRLRPKGEAHGGKSRSRGGGWLRLNFPTAEEEAVAKGAGMQPPKKKRKVQA